MRDIHDTRTEYEAGAKLDGPMVTMSIKPRVKRGIVINLPSPDGIVSFTLTDGNGDWCGDGRMKVEHYSEESLQFIRGFLDYNCPPTSPASEASPVTGSPRFSRRRTP